MAGGEMYGRGEDEEERMKKEKMKR